MLGIFLNMVLIVIGRQILLPRELEVVRQPNCQTPAKPARGWLGPAAASGPGISWTSMQRHSPAVAASRSSSAEPCWATWRPGTLWATTWPRAGGASSRWCRRCGCRWRWAATRTTWWAGPTTWTRAGWRRCGKRAPKLSRGFCSKGDAAYFIIYLKGLQIERSLWLSRRRRRRGFAGNLRLII